jgi:hypothetical protein
MDATSNKAVLERRSKARYPVKLTVRYRTIGRTHVVGTGHTLNMSSGGLLVSAEHDFNEGLRLEVNVEWPLLLDGSIPLQLVANGKIVRSADSTFAISFAQYQFRTMSRVLKASGMEMSDAMGLMGKRMARA